MNSFLRKGFGTSLLGLVCSLGLGHQPLWGAPLPPAEDIPEEVMQIDIYEEATSVLDGQVITPATDAQQRDAIRIREEDLPGRLAPEVYQVMFLLKLRSIVRGLLPFL